MGLEGALTQILKANQKSTSTQTALNMTTAGLKNNENPEKTSFYTDKPIENEYCNKCGELSRKSFFVPFMKRYISPFLACKCKRRADENYRLELENREKLDKVKRLQGLSLLGTHYKNVSFETTRTGENKLFDKAFNFCKSYAENWKQALSENRGIYLFGTAGTGKTHLTACIVNQLLKNTVPVLFTSLFEISNAVKKTFQKGSIDTEQSLMNRFNHVDFLVFDDIGAETFNDWQRELLYNLINSRLNANKPTIFTSNYSVSELEDKRKINNRTVDRIHAMTKTAVFEISGKSLRGKQLSIGESTGFTPDGDMVF